MDAAEHAPDTPPSEGARNTPPSEGARNTPPSEGARNAAPSGRASDRRESSETHPERAARPETISDAAAILRELARERATVRPVGGRTKLSWGPPAPAPLTAHTAPAAGAPAAPSTPARATSAHVELATGGLARIVSHDRGDFTAVLQAGVPLGEAQAAFAQAGQRLALDPPLDDVEAATIGGVLATGDSGPARHRYGAARDLVIGITVVLSDGTIARAGGKVIKNVAGYDLCKLFVGSYGTLGLIVEVCLRLHPLPRMTATLRAQSADPAALAGAAATLSRLPLEAESLDLGWRRDDGDLLVRFAGPAAAQRARHASQHLVALEHVEIYEDDEPLWQEQRSLQRATHGAVLKVSALPSELPLVLAVARRAGASVVARAALGLCWLAFAPGEGLPQRVAAARAELAPRACVILDGGARLHEDEALRGDRSLPHGASSGPPAVSTPTDGAIALMERVRQRFDPAGLFRPGVPLGDI
jgi:glycolate oxidase FAD binding subunit